MPHGKCVVCTNECVQLLCGPFFRAPGLISGPGISHTRFCRRVAADRHGWMVLLLNKLLNKLQPTHGRFELLIPLRCIVRCRAVTPLGGRIQYAPHQYYLLLYLSLRVQFMFSFYKLKRHSSWLSPTMLPRPFIYIVLGLNKIFW